MELEGKNIVGGLLQDGEAEWSVHATNPADGAVLAPNYASASAAQVRRACREAAAAAVAYRRTTLDARAAFLDAIADSIESLGPQLIHRAVAETGLPEARIQGERGRTTGQLRLFADTVRKGDFLEYRVEAADPNRSPLPRPELRTINIPLGPVAVFGASNFPLAFSVAGGDTAAALAAGCPVVFKAHPAHPGVCELVGRAILDAIEQQGLPIGLFSLLFDAGHDVGQALVKDADIKAVAFTGSRRGGLALAAAAAQRAEPIPVYAEMGSINPVFLLPAALGDDVTAKAKGWLASLQQGAGQFCTNPGLLVALGGPALDQFTAELAKEVANAKPQTMLSGQICAAYKRGVEALEAQEATSLVAAGPSNTDLPNGCRVHVFSTPADAFILDPRLGEEVFGACGLIVTCRDPEEMLRVANALEGQLTATIHLAETDDGNLVRQLLEILDYKAGRIVFNGWPTGVEVSPAMVHGGPYPATTDPRATSVGSAAIRRFLRPLCYQDCPAQIHPQFGHLVNLSGSRRF